MTSPTNHTLASLAQKMGGGSGLLTAWCGMTDPIMAGVLAREFDTVTLDMQHGCYDIASITNSVAHVAAAGKPAIVRIPVGQFAIASRVLDLGASAVIAPMINSVEDAKAFASFMKYPPIGERSWGPAIPLTMTDMPAGDYLKQANKFSLALAMIETRAAIDALDGILSVDGIDGVFVGPSDTSIALSNGAHVDATHPDVTKTLDHVVARCKAHKKLACCFSPTPAVAGEWIKKGYDLLALGTDFMQVRVGARAMIEQVRK